MKIKESLNFLVGLWNFLGFRKNIHNKMNFEDEDQWSL
jgi:hypothetical protein